MAEATVTPKSVTSYPHRGHADNSWARCVNCHGYGHLTQEVAIMIAQSVDPVTGRSSWPGPGGLKGDVCVVCNGVGRVPDSKWPQCPCGGAEGCIVCHGLGHMSPERQASLKAQLEAHQAQLATLKESIATLQAARKASSAP